MTVGATGGARSAVLACSLAAALAAAGCGASASPSSSSGSASASASTPSSTSTPTSASTPTSTSTPAATSTGSGATTSASGATTTAGSTAGRLVATTGYATYEDCAGTCSGAVPKALRRPLHLPSLDGAPCPVTISVDGPVAPSTSTEVGIADVEGSAWLSAPVTWTAAASYTGPILIRGAEVGGSDRLGFGEASTPYDELQLLDSGRGAPARAGRRAWLTETRAQAPGCYAYQVDGTDFSEVIVFRAVG